MILDVIIRELSKLGQSLRLSEMRRLYAEFFQFGFDAGIRIQESGKYNSLILWGIIPCSVFRLRAGSMGVSNVSSMGSRANE
jgi:hypothetical protein